MATTRRPVFRTRPGKQLVWATAASLIVTFALPETALGRLLGFVPLPLYVVSVICGIVLGYLVVVEIVKHWFYQVIKTS